MERNVFVPHSPLLARAVQQFWQLRRSNTHFRQETILPKGVVEIIFSFQETSSFQAQMDGQTYQLPKCFINGYNTQPLHLHLAARQTFFGVVFHPTAIRKIFGVPASEFMDQCIDVSLIDSSFTSLWHRLAETQLFTDRVAVFSEWLTKRFVDITRQEQFLNDFLNTKTNLVLSVAELADLVCYSPRHLSRKLQELTGMNTEETLRYKKYLRALNLIHQPEQSLTEIAYACGFADQSHFTKTFKAFTRLSPKEYRNSRSYVVGHIFENVR